MKLYRKNADFGNKADLLQLRLKFVIHLISHAKCIFFWTS